MPNEEKKDIGAPERKEAAAPGREGAPKEARKTGRKKRGAPVRRKAAEKGEGEGIERVVKINRVSKVVKGGKNFSFSALVVTGDGKGRVGIGFGKSNEVVGAIKKGTVKANRNLFKVNMRGDTIPHEVIGEFKASRVLLKPAGPGTGVIAGGPVRALCDAAGIKNILAKSLGSRNAINVVRATMEGFKGLRLRRR